MAIDAITAMAIGVYGITYFRKFSLGNAPSVIISDITLKPV